ncbi:MAG: VOC family protein [Haloarculaceae archaeon]
MTALTQVYLMVTDVEASREFYETVFDLDVAEESGGKVEHGASVPAEPRVTDWGRKLCLVEDPDGYVFEVSRPA